MKEKLSRLCHNRWSDWMNSFFTDEIFNENDIRSSELLAARCRRMNTPYEHLSEAIKEELREEADKFIEILLEEEQP